jgi:hypothetical protein
MLPAGPQSFGLAGTGDLNCDKTVELEPAIRLPAGQGWPVETLAACPRQQPLAAAECTVPCYLSQAR